MLASRMHPALGHFGSPASLQPKLESKSVGTKNLEEFSQYQTINLGVLVGMETNFGFL